MVQAGSCTICLLIVVVVPGMHLSLGTVVLNSRDWSEKQIITMPYEVQKICDYTCYKNGVWNFGMSKIHLIEYALHKNLLKCIGTTIITLYLC